jgi:hypothetical protein
VCKESEVIGAILLISGLSFFALAIAMAVERTLKKLKYHQLF